MDRGLVMDRPVMQRDNEQARIVVVGRLVDGGGQCTVIAVHYRSPRRWVLYPHGAGKLGVTLSDESATTLAEGILGEQPTSAAERDPLSEVGPGAP